TDPLGKPAVWLIEAPEQLSPYPTVKVLTAPHTPGSFTELIFPAQVISGICASCTVTVKLQFEAFPQSSVAVTFTVVVPIPKNEPGAISYAIEADPEQISLADEAKFTKAPHWFMSLLIMISAGHERAGAVLSS